MDWQKQMNEAMTYVERHLTEDIDYNAVSMMVGCSEWEFRRMFSFLAQMPLSEYIRRRRLTASISAIQNGEKIIDIAQRYGYESHAAYSRAFKRLYGVTPSLARNDKIALKPFRLTFKLVFKENEMMHNGTKHRETIRGSRDSEYAVSIDMDQENIHKTNESFWDSVGTELIGCTSLPNYGAFVTEETCPFFKRFLGKKFLR